jgi:hypothetical protein
LIIKATKTRIEHLLAAKMLFAPNKFSKKSIQAVIASTKSKTLQRRSSSIVVVARAERSVL